MKLKKKPQKPTQLIHRPGLWNHTEQESLDTVITEKIDGYW